MLKKIFNFIFGIKPKFEKKPPLDLRMLSDSKEDLKLFEDIIKYHADKGINRDILT